MNQVPFLGFGNNGNSNSIYKSYGSCYSLVSQSANAKMSVCQWLMK